MDAIADRAEPAIVTLVTGLAPEQIAHLVGQFAPHLAELSSEQAGQELVRAAKLAQSNARERELLRARARALPQH